MLKKKIKSAIKVFKNEYPGFKNVLDVGCREGYSTQYLIKANYNVHAIDIERKWIEHNKKKGRSVHWGNFLNYNFGTLKFDAIFSRHSIEHTGSIERFLIKCCDLLAPLGVLFLIFPLEQTVLLDMGKDDEKDTIEIDKAISIFRGMISLMKFKEDYFGPTKDYGIMPMDNDYLFIGRKI